MTQQEAIELADMFAANEIGDFDIKNYPDRTAEFDKSSNEWWVFYVYEPNRWLGDHFFNTINDKTKQLEFIGGR